MNDKLNNSKPTSPHLQIYRWNISSITSIMHRLTGVALFFSILLLAWAIVYYTYKVDMIETSESCECLMNNIIQFVLVGAVTALTFSIYYHLCNGIRHLFWDIGKGFELKNARLNGYIVITMSLLLTVVTFAITIYLKLF